MNKIILAKNKTRSRGLEMSDTDKAVRYIKSKGFRYIKIELEGNYSQSAGSRYSTCDCCDGDYENCEYCSDGTEYVNSFCQMCNEGSVENDYGIEYDDIYRKLLSDKARDAIEFMYWYDDGSVNTEVTLTISLDNSILLPEYVKAFKDLGKSTGHFDDKGAGLHISLLYSNEYPNHQYGLDIVKYHNFKQAINELMPSLFLLGSKGNGYTREFSYRMPRVSSSDKYTAIYTHNNSMLEYRLFDPCYDDPQRILHFVGIIAKTLYFYSNKAKNIKAKTQLGYLEVNSRFPNDDLVDLIKSNKNKDIISDFKKLYRTRVEQMVKMPRAKKDIITRIASFKCVA